jgi:hypothetical protein
MHSFRNNPDSNENQAATTQHEREVFALQMQHRKKASGMLHTTSCPSCNAEFDVEVTPYIPARTYGDPSNCHPAEGGDVEPSHCPTCDYKLDTGLIYEEWAEERRDRESAYPEDRDYDDI